MAPTLLEHDYIGLSGTQQPPPPPPDDGNGDDGDLGGLLTGTELRLGLPGSESKLLLQLLPQRKDNISSVPVLSLAPPKGALGAKRGFSDTIAGSDNMLNGVGNGVAKDGPAPGSVAAAANMDNKGQAADTAADAAAGGTDRGIAPAAKAQVVGWPPIRSYRKNTMAANPSKNNDDDEEEKQDSSCLYVKVSMDGAPYLRKVDLKMYTNYKELSTALDKMFSCFTAGQCGSHGAPGKDGHKDSRLSDLRGSDLVVTYEDKDGDWMLVGDVPWDMFTDSCRRLRIMKGSDAIGLAPRAMEKCKNKN